MSSAGEGRTTTRRSRARTKARDLSRNPILIVGSFLFAFASLILSGLGYRLSQNTASEQQAVVLRVVHPFVREIDLTETEAGIHVVFVNESLRRIIIPSASLWMMKNCKVGDADHWLPAATAFDRRDLHANWSDQLLDFPITIDARQGASMIVMVPIFSPCVQDIASESDFRRSEKSERMLKNAIAVADAKVNRRLHLRLRLTREPGGIQQVPVTIEPGMTAGESWQTSWELRGQRFLGISIRKKLGELGWATLMSIDLWSERTGKHLHVTRPLVGAEFSFFPLGGLSKGSY